MAAQSVAPWKRLNVALPILSTDHTSIHIGRLHAKKQPTHPENSFFFFRCDSWQNYRRSAITYLLHRISHRIRWTHAVVEMKAMAASAVAFSVFHVHSTATPCVRWERQRQRCIVCSLQRRMRSSAQRCVSVLARLYGNAIVGSSIKRTFVVAHNESLLLYTN